MNLIITCQRNLEEPTILEIHNILERFGDTDAVVEKTVFSIIASISPNLSKIFRISKIVGSSRFL